MKRTLKRTALMALLLSWVLLAAGCLKGADKPVVVELDEVKVRQDEVMVYLLQTVNAFEKLGGEDVWDVEDFSGGKTAGEVAKERALENLIKTRIIASKQEELGIEPDESARQPVEQQAASYYDSLDPAFTERYGIDRDTVLGVFMDSKVSSLVVEAVMASTEINDQDIEALLMENQDYVDAGTFPPEILLAQVAVKRVFIAAPQDEEAALEARGRMEEALALLEEGASMDAAIEGYSEEPAEIIRTSAGLLSREEALALRTLEPGGHSGILAGEDGWSILQLLELEPPSEEAVADYERQLAQWEAQLREEAAIQLKAEAFEAIYSQWKQETAINIDQEVWGGISHEDAR